MRIGILGPLSVEVAGTAVEIASATQRRALIFLALHANEVISSDHLADAIWRDQTPSDPRHAIHSLVHRLRRHVDLPGGGLSILRHDPGYALEIDPHDIDANCFCDYVRQARSIPRDRPADAAEVLQAGLDLWRGDALLDVAYEAWAASEIRRLTEIRVSACEGLARVNLHRGRGEVAIAELESLTERFPLRESLWRLLWEALAQAGRHLEVTASYQRAVGILANDYGIHPSAQLRESAGGFAAPLGA